MKKRDKCSHNMPYTKGLASSMSTMFGLSRESSMNLIKMMNRHSLHETLGNVLDAESKVYTCTIEIPMIGTLTVSRDKQNNITSTIELTDEYKSDVIRTMNGESLFTEFIDQNMIDSIKNKYNRML